MPRELGPSAGGYLPLVETARAAGRSVRVLQRWIAAGLVDKVPDPADRRRTLVDPRQVERVAAGRRRRGGGRPGAGRA